MGEPNFFSFTGGIPLANGRMKAPVGNYTYFNGNENFLWMLNKDDVLELPKEASLNGLFTADEDDENLRYWKYTNYNRSTRGASGIVKKNRIIAPITHIQSYNTETEAWETTGAIVAVKEIKKSSNSYSVHELNGTGYIKDPLTFLVPKTKTLYGETYTEDTWHFDMTKNFKDTINDGNFFFESGKRMLYRRDTRTGATQYNPYVTMGLITMDPNPWGNTFCDGRFMSADFNDNQLTAWGDGTVRISGDSGSTYFNKIEVDTLNATCYSLKDFTITLTNLTTGSVASYTGDLSDFHASFKWSSGVKIDINSIRDDLVSIPCNGGDDIKLEVDADDGSFHFEREAGTSSSHAANTFAFIWYAGVFSTSGAYSQTESRLMLNIRHQEEQQDEVDCDYVDFETYDESINTFTETENEASLALNPISYDVEFDMPLGKVKTAEGGMKTLSYFAEYKYNEATEACELNTEVRLGGETTELTLPTEMESCLGLNVLDWEREGHENEFTEFARRIIGTKHKLYFFEQGWTETSPGVSVLDHYFLHQFYPETNTVRLDSAGRLFSIDQYFFIIPTISTNESITVFNLATVNETVIEAKEAYPYINPFAPSYGSKLSKDKYLFWGSSGHPEYALLVDLSVGEHQMVFKGIFPYNWKKVNKILGTHNGKIVIRFVENTTIDPETGNRVAGDFENYILFDVQNHTHTTITSSEEITGEELKYAFEVSEALNLY